jgi:site-specific DNA-cytosine methylase
LDTFKLVNFVLKSLSLFSGCGGLDSGVFQASFTPLAMAEVTPHATKTLSHWLGLTLGSFCLLEPCLSGRYFLLWLEDILFQSHVNLLET